MIIANYQVQKTLRAYSQQLAERTRLSKTKAQKNVAPKDQISLSPEGKKRLLAEKIATQIITQFATGADLNDTHREILKRLSNEYKFGIEMEIKEGRGLAFKISPGDSPDGPRYLSAEETEKAKRKLFEITQSVVYNNLG